MPTPTTKRDNPWKRKIAPNGENDPAYAKKMRSDMVRGEMRKEMKHEADAYYSVSEKTLRRTGTKRPELDKSDTEKYGSGKNMYGWDASFASYKKANQAAVRAESAQNQKKKSLIESRERIRKAISGSSAKSSVDAIRKPIGGGKKRDNKEERTRRNGRKTIRPTKGIIE